MHEHRRRVSERLSSDRAVVREAAGIIRRAPLDSRWAALSEPTTAALMASMLEVLAASLELLDPAVRGHLVRVCHEFAGRSMDQPTTRRTRRRR